jgi:hypothetical protein
VACVVPTLIQEVGIGTRPVEDKRADLAALPSELRLSDEDVEAIRGVGDNTGCMTLKGGSPDYEGDDSPDRWVIDGALEDVARRWGIEPERDLSHVATAL